MVLKYVEAEGKCPITGTDLSSEDLVGIRTDGATKPRIATTSSVPGLLAMFQNEWDALMLETFHLKKNLDTVRKELSQSLYQYDAACRVIARLVKERDEARRALSQMGGASNTSTTQASPSNNNNNNNNNNADAMEVDVNSGLPSSILQHIENTSNVLAKGRKKRPKPATLPKKDVMKTFSQTLKKKIRSAKSSCIDLHRDDNTVILGDKSGSVRVFDKSSGKTVTLKGHKKNVTSVSCDRERDVFYSTSEDGTVRMWSMDQKSKKYETVAECDAHKDAVTDLSIHPTGKYVATSSKDGSFAFHEVSTDGGFQTHFQVHLTGKDIEVSAVKFHPDGALVAVGTSDGRLDVYQVKNATSKPAVSIKLDGPIVSLCFSENGYYLACGMQNVVKLFDLRKPEASMTAQTEELENGEILSQVRFDHSGTYLATATSSGVVTRHAKKWEKLAVLDSERSGKFGVSGVVFASDSTFILSCGLNGEFSVSSASEE